MTVLILATKLQRPPLPRSVVPRERLVREIERAVRTSKLTLVTAPAGYGKTTALQQWAQATSMPVGWLSLDRRDDEIERFLRYLYAAWEAVQPELAETQLGVLLGGMSPDGERVLSEFVNAASRLPEQTALLLDDYHLIESPEIHAALGYLMDNAPPSLHFLLSSRSEPPLPLARYRARQEMQTVGIAELAFQPDEAANLLAARLGPKLTRDVPVAIQEQVEGWAAGLQLAALALEQGGTAEPEIGISGRQRFVAEYLREEVFGNLPDDVQGFLLRVSVLDSLHAPLCDAITGRSDGQVMLEALERANLFVVALDDERSWFRFHPLFGEFLRSALDSRAAGDLPEIHRRAAAWYLDNDRPEQAFDHAIAGDDPEIACRILERYLNFKLNTGDIVTIRGWLDAMPSHWFESFPVVGLARVGFLAYTGAFEECMRCIDDVERRVASDAGEETGWQRAMVSAVRCFIACIGNDLPRAEREARRALPGLRHDSLPFRAGIHQALGDTYRRNGHWRRAREAYLETLSFLEVPPFREQFAVHSVHVYGALADLELGQGHLRAAREYWRTAIETAQSQASWGRLELPLTGWLHIRMGEALYEINDLDAAADHLGRGLERVELGGDVRAQIAGYLVAGRLRLTRGDLDSAERYLGRAGALLDTAPFPEWRARYERLRVELWLAQNRLRAAVTWVDELTDDRLGPAAPEHEITALALARVLIFIGDDRSLRRALDLLDHLIADAAASGRTAVEIEGLALRAMAHRAQSEPVEALQAFERALRLAEPEGYVRLFADFGPPMAWLLGDARARGVHPEYVDVLLSTVGTDMPAHSAVPVLTEALTDREREILELIAAGLTNPEIAAKLYISPQTVGKHAGNIYGKLAVHTRTEATTRARELGLLS